MFVRACIHTVIICYRLRLVSYVVDVVSELPSLTHAQLSEPSIQLTALPVPYTTDYTFMHNSQHAHNISMPHYSPSFLSSRQFESCCGSVRTSRRPSPLSLLSGISTVTHYIHTYYILISGRLTLHWCQNCLTFALCSAFLTFSSVFFLAISLL